MLFPFRDYLPGGTQGLPSANVVLNEVAVFPGGTQGFPSANAGRVIVNIDRVASKNKHFFTVKLLVEVCEHRDNVA